MLGDLQTFVRYLCFERTDLLHNGVPALDLLFLLHLDRLDVPFGLRVWLMVHVMLSNAR